MKTKSWLVYVKLSILSCFIVGCASVTPTVSIYSPPKEYTPPEPDRKETISFSTLKLVNTAPTLRRTDAPINIERLYSVQSTFYPYSGWSTIRVSIFTGREKIEAASDQVTWRFGVSSPGLTSSDPVEQRASSAPATLTIEITNIGKTGLTVDWNAVSIVNQAGEAHKVIHKGVKMDDRSGVLAPSTIPPGATLDDFIYPSEYITFRSGDRYRSSAWLGRNFIEGMRPGNRFRVFFPLKSTAGEIEYQFTFEVGDPVKQPTKIEIEPVKPIVVVPPQPEATINAEGKRIPAGTCENLRTRSASTETLREYGCISE